jgi:hypothetical protein
MKIILDRQLSDEAKERALQQNAKWLFALGFWIAVGAAIALLSPTGIVWICSQLDLVSFAAVCDVLASPTFIIITCLIACLPIYLSYRFRKNDEMTNYPVLDRVLHRIAFHTVPAQLAIADMEDRIYEKELEECRVDRPVFITALPRAGTTMLLEFCANTGEFASHSYRDMPFVFTPCLWNRFSGSFRKEAKPQERAHGDGMLIDFNSPEALEEVLWKAFWKKQYCQDRIVPWSTDAEDVDDFKTFFQNHMRKIRAVRLGTNAANSRYLSKNNLNIARTSLLQKFFPEALIIVPFREPLQHANSLLKQHRNFSQLHKEDPFAAEYMLSIGHYDFGQNLRPVDFDGWLDRRQSKDADKLGFWLEYWTACYRHLLREADHLHFANYDALCMNPERGMRWMATTLGCREPEALVAAAAQIHRPRAVTIDTHDVSASILRDVQEVYDELQAQTDWTTQPSIPLQVQEASLGWNGYIPNTILPSAGENTLGAL